MSAQGRPAQPAADEVPETSAAARALITLAVISGAFISVMDVSVVNVSLPHMRGAFGADLSSITWVATSYSIAQIIMITMSGWWSTLLGRKRFFLASYVLFTLGSILAGISSSFTEMIVYRAIQGVGGGPLIPIAQAIMRETYPPRYQGMAMAVFGMGVVVAPAIGPVLGGWLTDTYGWPWVFYINVPFSLGGMVLVHLFVHDPPYLKRGIKRVDWGGIAFLAIGLIGLQVVLERGQEENWFESNLIVWWSAATVVAVAVLVVWELRVPEPIVDIRIMRNVPLTVGSVIILVFGVALFGSTFVLPQFLQHLLHYTAYDAGMVLLPRGIALFIILPIVGRLFNVLDLRLLLTFGTASILYAFYLISHLSLDADFWSLVMPLIFMGLGMPCMFVTLATVTLGCVRAAEATAASAVFNLFRRVGGNIGFALIATLVDRRSAVHRTGLVGYLNEFNAPFLDYHEKVVNVLTSQRIDPATAQAKAYAIMDNMVNRQAAMGAYNDAAWFMMILFTCVLPLIWLLPGRLGARPEGAGGGG